MSNFFDKLINLIIDQLSTTITSLNENDTSCNYCKKDILRGYSYKCLNCYDYDLCNNCFEKRKFNESHQNNHKLLRLNVPNKGFFDFKNEELYFENLKEKFTNETHQGVKCNNCKIEPIKGLRFKCDICLDFNLCEKCCDRTLDKHLKSHPLITYCKTTSFEIDHKKIKMLEKLGEGGFGKVCKAEYANQILACKIIEARKTGLNSSQYENLRKSYIRELNGYNEIIGDNILKMIGHCSIPVTNGHNFIILTELMNKGSLEDLIKNEPNLTNRRRFNILSGIARGMARIHDIGFIHRDIRPANILVNSNYVPKIGDMGIAKFYEDNSILTEIGCRKYMPPEFYGGNYTKKLDVFTFGLTINELFNGNQIFINRKIKITQQGAVIWNELISKCIEDDPSCRPSSKHIDDQVSFMNSYINEQIDKNKSYYQYDKTTKNRNDIFEFNYKAALIEFKNLKLEEDKKLSKENNKKVLEYYLKMLKDEEYFNTSYKDTEIPELLSSISVCYEIDENKEKSFEYAQKSLDKKIEILQENSIKIATGYGRLARINFKMVKDYKLALELYNKALDISLKVYGEYSAESSFYYFRLGECHYELNQFDESVELHLKSLEIRRRIYDRDSEYIVSSLNALKECFLKMNDIDNYLLYRREELKIKRELFKLKHPNKIFGECFLIRGEDNQKPAWHYILVENEDKYEKIMKFEKGGNIDVTDFGKILKSGWGEKPPNYVVDQMSEMYDFDYPHFKNFKIDDKPIDDNFLNDNGDPVLKNLFESLKASFLFENGEDNIEVVERLNKISLYFYNIDDSYNSILYCKKSIDICKRLYRNQEPDKYTAYSLNIIGCCYLYILNDESSALEYFKQVHEMRLKLYGEEHPLLANINARIGKCYFNKEKFNEALPYYQKCLEIRKKVYTNQINYYLSYAYSDLKECYEKMGDTENYFHYRREEIKVKCELYKLKHPDKEYKDVMLIRGKDKGKPAWHYILVEDEDKYEKIRKLEKGGNIDVTDFGKILRSGWGVNPSKSVVNDIEKEYGIEPNIDS